MRLNVSRNVLLTVIVITIIVFAEIFCRIILGLGDPPIYITDKSVEYLLKPNQSLKRFGNHVFVNNWGMRSVNFSQKKQNSNEVRVLFFGDSVINGGSETDQSLLATTLLQQRLQTLTSKPVIVGNVSAGSWGPGNWLAYARRYGFFDADIIVLIVNSGDFADNPTFEHLESTHPTQKPMMALQEATFRYLPRYIPSYSKQAVEPKVQISQEAIAQGYSDLRTFLSLAKTGRRKVMMFHHPDKPELLANKFSQGHNEMRELAAELNITFFDLMPRYSKFGTAIYRDGIHPNPKGQKVLSDAFYDALIPILDTDQSYLKTNVL
jgi:sulfur relay (sulfurtransferase) complex TusBCD TusD component (DsrE family)